MKKKIMIYQLCFEAGSITFLIAILFLLQQHNHVLTLLSLLLVALESWFLIRITKKRITYTLTDKECELPIIRYVDLSNRFDWSRFLFCFLWCCLVCGLAWLFEPMLHQKMADLFMWCGVMIAVVLVACLEPIKNQYIIDDDVLIVREVVFFRRLAEIRIPIREIVKIELFNVYLPGAARVVLTVNGVERELRCTTHSVDLAREIALRL